MFLKLLDAYKVNIERQFALGVLRVLVLLQLLSRTGLVLPSQAGNVCSEVGTTNGSSCLTSFQTTSLGLYTKFQRKTSREGK